MDKQTTTTIGIIGGGQLCMMMAQAVREKQLPVEIAALDPSPRCPAHPYVDQLIVGPLKDEKKIWELAGRCDIITYETETTEGPILKALEEEGKVIHPSPDTLVTIQDKLLQARYLSSHGLPVPRFIEVTGKESFQEAIKAFGLPLMLKARRDSYDGRGNFVIRRESDIEEALNAFDGRKLMIQEFILFELEISVIAARNTKGEVRTFPVGENIHFENILFKTIVPARVDRHARTDARKIAHAALDVLEGAGVFGIEMFVTGDGRVLINEIAPRVHNSGHYTIEGCETSQFEQHIRAILGMPLGHTRLRHHHGLVVMQNLLGNDPEYHGPYHLEGTEDIDSETTVHFYNKEEVHFHRKMGHFTLVASDPEQTVEALMEKADALNKKIRYIPIKNIVSK